MSIQLCPYAESCNFYQERDSSDIKSRDVVRKDKQGYHCLVLPPSEECPEGLVSRLNKKVIGGQWNFKQT